jgi:very-short-patch-repair endonuclease
MAEAESGMKERRFYDSPLPAGERAGLRSEPGEGLTRRGKTPEHLLTRAKQMRHEPTPQEEALWERLRAKRLYGWKFHHQSPLGPFIPDFSCPKAKLIIELDGSQHSEREGYDADRTAFLEHQGYRVLRFWNCDIDQNLDGVLMLIRETLSAPLPAREAGLPSPLQGEG